MRINNSTQLRTEDLKKLFLRCVKEVEKIEKPRIRFKEKNRGFTLNVKNSRYYKTGMSGNAYLGGYTINLMIPKTLQTEAMPIERRRGLARLLIHEYYHIIGFRYWDNHHYKYDSSSSWNVDWVSEYEVGLQIKEPKVRVDIQAVRYERAMNNLEKAMTRFKRAKTIMTKWKSRVKYYEVALARKK